jgi:transcription elongation factor Elf1
MKYCPRCKENKPLDAFFKKKDRRASSYCKPCQLEYVREHYRRTSGAYNARRYALHQVYTDRNRRIVLAHLRAHPCIDCGEHDIVVLDFDHVSGQKHGNISRLIRGGTSIETLEAEIAKCVVRCSNCHRRKTASERGSFRMTPWLYEGEISPMLTLGTMINLWDGGGSNSRQMA